MSSRLSAKEAGETLFPLDDPAEIMHAAAQNETPMARIQARLDGPLDSHAVQEAQRALLADITVLLCHEINNPLAAIAGYAQLLRDRFPDPTDQRALEAILNQSARIHAVLERLKHLEQVSERPYLGDTTMLDLGE